MATVEITYCVTWGYLPRATSLAAEIRKSRQAEVKLNKGSGGQFEVVVDGTLIFSKKAVGRFPEMDEVLSKIPQ